MYWILIHFCSNSSVQDYLLFNFSMCYKNENKNEYSVLSPRLNNSGSNITFLFLCQRMLESGKSNLALCPVDNLLLDHMT